MTVSAAAGTAADDLYLEVYQVGENEVAIEGVATPGATIDVFYEGGWIDTRVADTDGSWYVPLNRRGIFTSNGEVLDVELTFNGRTLAATVIVGSGTVGAVGTGVDISSEIKP